MSAIKKKNSTSTKKQQLTTAVSPAVDSIISNKSQQTIIDNANVAADRTAFEFRSDNLQTRLEEEVYDLLFSSSSVA